MDDTSVLNRLPDAVARVFRLAFADSMGEIFLIVAALSFVGLVLLLLWKPVTLPGRVTTPAAAAKPHPEPAGGKTAG